MTCESIRSALLGAELSELRGEGTGELAAHLRRCATCRGEALRIIAATEALGRFVRRRRRRTAWARVVLPLAAAAGVVFWLTPAGGAGTTTEAPGGSAVISPPATIAAGPVRPTTAVGPARGGAARTAPIAPERFAGMAPVAAVAVVATPLPAATLQASAPEPARKRPRVLPTSDPAITLLWLE